MRYIIIAILSFLAFSLKAQSIESFGARFSIVTDTLIPGSDDFYIRGYLRHPRATFNADSTQVGDIIVDADCNIFTVDSILQTNGQYLRARITPQDTTINDIRPATGGIIRLNSPPNGTYTIPANVPIEIIDCFLNYNFQALSGLDTVYYDSDTLYIVTPAETYKAYIPAPALNSLPDVDTAGLQVDNLLKWDGTDWVPATTSWIVSDAGAPTGSGVSGQVAYWNGTNTLTGNVGFTHSATASPSWIFRPPGLASNDPRITVTTNSLSTSYIDIAGGSSSWDSQIRWLTGGVASGVTWSLGNDGNASNNDLVLRNEFRAKDAVVFSNASTPTYTFDMWNYGDYIFNNGDFGIGRTPSYRLDVNTGGVRITPQATDIVQAQGALYYDTDGNGFRGGDGSNLYYLPWIDDPSPAANRIPYSDGSKLITDADMTFDGYTASISAVKTYQVISGHENSSVGMFFGTGSPRLYFNLHNGGNENYAEFRSSTGSARARIGKHSSPGGAGSNYGIALSGGAESSSPTLSTVGAGESLYITTCYNVNSAAGSIVIQPGTAIHSTNAGNLYLRGGKQDAESIGAVSGLTGEIYVQTFFDHNQQDSATTTRKHMTFSGRGSRITTQLHNLYDANTINYALVMNGDTIKRATPADIVTLGTADGLQFTVLNSPPVGAEGNLYSNNDGYLYYHDGVSFKKLLMSGSLLAANGLTMSGDSTILGGTLNKSTTIAGGAYGLTVTRNSSGFVLDAGNTSTGKGLRGYSMNNGVGVTAYTDGSSTSSILPALDIQVGTSGTAAAGIGAAADFYIETTSGSLPLAGRIAYQWTDATAVDAESKFTIYTRDSAITVPVITGDHLGKIANPAYGDGLITGTVSTIAAWDTNGNVIETTPAAIVASALPEPPHAEYNIYEAAPDTLTITALTPVKSSGTSNGSLEGFTYSAGRLTCDDINSYAYKMHYEAEITSNVSGVVVTVMIYVNGVEEIKSRRKQYLVSSDAPQIISTACVSRLNSTDYVEVFYDVSSSCDVRINNASLIINKI